MVSSTFQAVDGTSPGLTASRWLMPVLLIAASLALVVGAGWWGYDYQISGQASTSAELGSQATRSANAAAASPDPRTAQPMPPAPARSAVAAAAAPALSWPLWEFRWRQPIPPRDPPLTPLRWRLVGSTLSGGKWAIIVLRQGKTDPEYFNVGQELPGGYRIAAISEEDVTLVQGKRTMVLSYIGSR
jgi:hypothetical protein